MSTARSRGARGLGAGLGGVRAGAKGEAPRCAGLGARGLRGCRGAGRGPHCRSPRAGAAGEGRGGAEGAIRARGCLRVGIFRGIRDLSPCQGGSGVETRTEGEEKGSSWVLQLNQYGIKLGF